VVKEKNRLVFRPNGYCYWDHLIECINDVDVIFNGTVIYPRQLEIHLPGDGKEACNFHCYYCTGKLFEKELGDWEKVGLRLIHMLNGRIPFHIYAGSHTEPIINPYFLDYLKATKKSGSNFGIHTNGSMLWRLEETNKLLTELCNISEKGDYLSISLDAGTTESHCKIKGLKYDWFSEILLGIRKVVELNKKFGNKLAVRICYLMNEYNSSQEEIDAIVSFVKVVGVDSLRFSMPTAYYAQDFKKIKEYKKRFERPNEKLYYERIQKHLINGKAPHIFWFAPELWDIDKLDFEQCVYGYYQITLGADGYFYRCSTVSSSIFEHLRLGKITDNLLEFKDILKKNQDSTFNTECCFKSGARCNRIATEINGNWRGFYDQR
jgi:MoaA/NifB/PqqE/SkfB family radical SAM enzyme